MIPGEHDPLEQLIDRRLADIAVNGQGLWDGRMMTAAQIREELVRGVEELEARPTGNPSVYQEILRRLDLATDVEDIYRE